MKLGLDGLSCVFYWICYLELWVQYLYYYRGYRMMDKQMEATIYYRTAKMIRQRRLVS